MCKLSLVIIFVMMIGASYSQNKYQNERPFEYEHVMDDKGYHFRYKTEDSERTEDGLVKEFKEDNRVITVSGFYSFVGTDGNTYRVDYVADENGYRPIVKFGFQSNILHKAEEMPIQKAREPQSSLVPYIGSAALDSLTGGGVG